MDNKDKQSVDEEKEKDIELAEEDLDSITGGVGGIPKGPTIPVPGPLIK